MTRVLVALSVIAPLVVGGVALLLVAKALAGTWFWGAIAFGTFVTGYAVAVVAVRRWAMRNPERANGFMSSWGRAMAFGSGGWEPSRERDAMKDE